MRKNSPKRALVLSGGGARGAYEAGVLRYIFEVLPDSLHHHPSFNIISGTSVGAINAAWLAATIDQPQRAMQRLWYVWRTLAFPDVIKPSYRELWRIFRTLFTHEMSLSLTHTHTGSREGGLLETGFFDSVIRQEIPFDNIYRNIQRGVLDAISVSATDIVTGQTTVFVQSKNVALPPWTRDPRRLALSGPITAEKVLASAAIPMLFPAVKIGHHWYCDGGLRQNTPISPALRMGANRVLVVSLQSKKQPLNTPHPVEYSAEPLNVEHPQLLFLAGKLLDALMLDPLDYDLTVLERINDLLRYGEEAFKDDQFVDKVNAIVQEHRGVGYRVVNPLLLRASQDLGQLAAEFASDLPDDFWGSKPMQLIGRKAFNRDGYRESDLLSYLLFDGGYTGKLLQLGFDDAATRHDELVAFFSD